LGTPIIETNPNGAVTRARYDELGRLIKVVQPGDDIDLSPTLVITYHDPMTSTVPLWIELQQKIDDATFYRARFRFDASSLSMAGGDSFQLFRGLSGTSTAVVRVELRYASGQLSLRAGLVDDGTTWSSTAWRPVSEGAHTVEIDWQAASGDGAGDGYVYLWVDGEPSAEAWGIDNDTRRVDLAQLGAVSGIDSGTRGTAPSTTLTRGGVPSWEPWPGSTGWRSIGGRMRPCWMGSSWSA
jgi:YD repeat-containing protein